MRVVTHKSLEKCNIFKRNFINLKIIFYCFYSLQIQNQNRYLQTITMLQTIAMLLNSDLQNNFHQVQKQQEIKSN